MDQHPIPRQITTFEFKLIGFLTLRQFLYLLISFPLAFVIFKILPIPIFNIIFAVLTASLGLGLAFVPINERPLDVWIRNLAKRLTSPTQYTYIKQHAPIEFLRNLIFSSDPHRVLAHVDSQEKLTTYLSKTSKNASPFDEKKREIASLLQNPASLFAPKTVQPTPAASDTALPTPPPAPIAFTSLSSEKKPFFTGIVKNHKLIPLPGILIYVRNEKSEVVRLLKTNPHGIFATFNPLPPGIYEFEVKDLKDAYFFDTMKIPIGETNPKPLEFYSKELL
ncbi:hypothetical protein COT62_03440 [Candidatus Roizmanbacteria bacterium CG09_land_8_20_14_0_10_41_9]|uniref:PrgI family protein n=1 Tax=Candidatus Roizmanbacteria bacterium CG09_land_8_20_14_0_10_41_9 TaxID=1974850 RepID=A0A2H0WU62_9BACT|nr:MAG: hypothetical protein COT62_03440 [Candidatus Roizmanbacteria bacterium CG09_land_8_20_14_0_10_41_9]